MADRSGRSLPVPFASPHTIVPATLRWLGLALLAALAGVACASPEAAPPPGAAEAATAEAPAASAAPPAAADDGWIEIRLAWPEPPLDGWIEALLAAREPAADGWIVAALPHAAPAAAPRTAAETPDPAAPSWPPDTPIAEILPPPLPPSVFEEAQVVSFYGYPGIPVMGELGIHSPREAIDRVARVAAEYDALNGERRVLPALHLIVAVAQRDPGADGRYLVRMERPLLDAYVEAARDRGALLFVDVQIGWSDPLTEVQWLEDALREPFVHLALDPEFATASRGAAPGGVIGSLGAADVNAVQRYLAGLVREHRLPPKIVVLHQFLPSMLTGTGDWEDWAEVELTVDMDGFGGQYAKLTKYDLFALSDYSERPAIKLFYHWDAPVLTPAQLQGLARVPQGPHASYRGDEVRLTHPPDLVIYQ